MFIFLFLKRYLETILQKTGATTPSPSSCQLPVWHRYVKAKARGEAHPPSWGLGTRRPHTPLHRVNRKPSPSCSLSRPASQSRLSQPCRWRDLCPPHLQDKGQKEALTVSFPRPRRESRTAGSVGATTSGSTGQMTDPKIFPHITKEILLDFISSYNPFLPCHLGYLAIPQCAKLFPASGPLLMLFPLRG